MSCVCVFSIMAERPVVPDMERHCPVKKAEAGSFPYVETFRGDGSGPFRGSLGLGRVL